MKIGEVARKLDMPASTIHYYEKVGLIEQQPRVSGRRRFDDRALSALRFVQLAQTAGFSIDETKSLLDNFAKNPTDSGIWNSFAEAKQVQVRRQIDSLQQMDRVLSELITCRCGSIEACVKLATTSDAVCG